MAATVPTEEHSSENPESSNNEDEDVQVRAIKGWQLYDWAESATVLAFNYFIPVYVNEAGRRRGWAAGGKALWAYLTAGATLLTLALFLTVTGAAEYGGLKRAMLRRCTQLGAASMILMLASATPKYIWVVSILFIVSKVLNRVSGVAHAGGGGGGRAKEDNNNVHRVAAQAYMLGYAAMLVYTFLAGGAFTIWLPSYFERENSSAYEEATTTTSADNESGDSSGQTTFIWLEYLCPAALAGLWWLGFGLLAIKMMTRSSCLGRPFPEEDFGVMSAFSLPCGSRKDSWLSILHFSAYRGWHDQRRTIRQIWMMRDLRNVLISFLFLSDSSSTMMSVAAIIATDKLGMSGTLVAQCVALGIAAGVLGLWIFRELNKKGVGPKPILVINITILSILCLFSPYLRTSIHLLTWCTIAGTQIGSVGAFSKSLLTTMIPFDRQASFFSLFEFTQKGTPWIGPLLIGVAVEKLGDNWYVEIVVATVLLEVLIGFPIFIFAVNPKQGQDTRKKIEEYDTKKQKCGAVSLQLCPPGTRYNNINSSKSNTSTTLGFLQQMYRTWKKS